MKFCFQTLWHIWYLSAVYEYKIKKWYSRMHSPLWFNERRKETITVVASKWALKGSVIWGHAVLCRGDVPEVCLCSRWWLAGGDVQTLTSYSMDRDVCCLCFCYIHEFTTLFNYSFRLVFICLCIIYMYLFVFLSVIFSLIFYTICVKHFAF